MLLQLQEAVRQVQKHQNIGMEKLIGIRRMKQGERIYARGSKKKITNLGYKKSSTKLLPINTILFTSRASIGNTAILAKEGCTNQGFQSIIPNSEKIDSYFIYTISNYIKKYALKHAAGSTFSEVSRKQMEQIKLLIPILKEQKQIGRLFQIINRKINKQIHKIELLKQRKKGLLQKMFIQFLIKTYYVNYKQRLKRC